TVIVPSTARPVPPAIHSVIPLFRWDEGTEPEQPMGYRRRRRAGVRIYLDRPWYSSGTGELLAILLAPGKDTEDSWTSKWGGDPVWESQGVDQRALSPLQLTDVLHLMGRDDDPGDALPVRRT